ncbi:hypothetical protein [Lyngbya aestuarii]|uniref:hypothetical protein n=1 Tax=Lyngbya aestuarii TaxID=118322 RepID=UPI00403E06ED
MATPSKLQPTSQLVTTQRALPMPLPGNRPISASKVQFRETVSWMGKRPIASSNITISDTLTISGNRPITSSALKFIEGENLVGNRPIASNEIDDEDLMGYLD